MPVAVLLTGMALPVVLIYHEVGSNDVQVGGQTNTSASHCEKFLLPAERLPIG